MTWAFGMAKKAIGLPIMAFAFVTAIGTPASAGTLGGRLIGTADTDGVWLGIVGDAEEANWTFIEGENFALPVPRGGAIVVAMARDRLPLVVHVPAGAPRPPLELRLSHGLELAGSVRSEDGLPLAGTVIRVAPVETTSRGAACGYATPLREAKITVSAADIGIEVPARARPSWEAGLGGAFRVGGLEAGRYLVEAVAEGHVPLLLEDVEIREDAANRLELVLSRGTFVTGRAVDQEGVPVGEVEVRAHWQVRRLAGSMDAVRWPCRGELAARAGAGGSYRIGPFETGQLVTVSGRSPELGETAVHEVPVPYGDLILEFGRRVVRGRVVDAATGEPIEHFQVAAYDEDSGDGAGSQSIQQEEGRFNVPVDAATDAIVIKALGCLPRFVRIFPGSSREYHIGDIALAGARTITGRVRTAKSGEPLAGVFVARSHLQYEDREEGAAVGWDSRYAATTDKKGAFVLGPLPRHADVLNVFVPGYGARMVNLPPDVSHLDVELTFDAVIAGSLVFPDGTPARGLVTLSEVGASGERGVIESPVLEDNTFRFRGLGGGKYRLTATSEAGLVKGRIVTLRADESVEDIRLVVDLGGRIAGLINGLVRGERARVAVRDAGRIVVEQTFSNGPYSLHGIPDKATVTAWTTSGRMLERKVQLDQTGEAHTDLNFSATSRLAGLVTSGGRPIGGLDLWVVPEDRLAPKARTKTSEQGRYAVRGLSYGRHFVQTRTGHSFEVEVTPDATLDIELPAVSLSGTLQARRTGVPVAGGWARLERTDAPVGSRPVVLGTRVDGDGTFRFEGLVEGEYVVSVSNGGFEDASRRVRVTASEEVDFDLDNADGVNAETGTTRQGAR